MATNITAKTFPGVYTSITDRSFTNPSVSRFRAGLIGVASKGPFNTPTAVRSIKEFRRLFGKPIAGSFFLANALSILDDLSDGSVVVRVGSQYTDVSAVSASGLAGGTVLNIASGKGQLFSPAAAPYGQGKPVFVKIKQPGLPSTANVQVTSASSGTITISSTGTLLQANYTAADVSFSNFTSAANPAESVINAYTYGTIASNQSDQEWALGAAGTITGTKNAFSFSISGNFSVISAGDVLKIKQTGKVTTWGVRVRSVTPDNVVQLEPVNLADVGYQALPLADSYDQGRIFKATGSVGFLYVEAATPGTWANGDDPTSGLYVKVLPGAKPGTKKFEVYEDNALVETIDNLLDDPTSDDYYPKRIGGAGYAQLSQYITIKYINSPGGQALHASNTVNGWNASATPQMPTGKINAGGSTGGSFHNGFNGETAQYSDFVGSIIDSNADTLSGIKAFEDENIDVDVICAPGMTDISGSITVHQELARVAKKTNAIALVDVPAGLNARQAVDWHNGTGLYSGRGRIDSANVAVYWNWFDTTDPFTTNVRKTVPPTLGALRCLAFTFDHDKPWYAAAGDTRGLIPEALTVEFTKVSSEAKAAMYGQGQSVNPILLDRGQIKLFGERTMQVAESKLSVVHNVVLVNVIVDNMALIARRFVFEPNDPELLIRLRLALSQFLDKVKNERGIEQYNLVLDDSNNTADTRNRREVIVDLDVVPVDAVERIFINAVVRQSGAELQSVT